MKGYIEWIGIYGGEYIGFITNMFNRVVYINTDFPAGSYQRATSDSNIIYRRHKSKMKRGREFDKGELLLELL